MVTTYLYTNYALSLYIYIDTCTNTYIIYIESILDKMFMNENANKIPVTTNEEAMIPN